MAEILKPQNPLKYENQYFYPLTSADQVVLEDNSRLNANIIYTNESNTQTTSKVKTLFSNSAKTEALFPRTKTSAVSNDSGTDLNTILQNKADVSTVNTKQSKHIPVSVSLTTSGWSSLTQTVSVSGVTANNTVIVTPAPASHVAYSEAGAYCSAQASGKLTFKCSQKPTSALTVNVLILN